MAVVLPTGWTTFNSGGEDPTLCDTGQPIVLIPTPISLVCSTDTKTIELEVTGGVPPFSWDTTEGRIEITGTRTAELSIDDAVDFGTTQITINSQGYNPCALVAYVIRGRAVSWNANPEDSNCNNAEFCHGSMYNCIGEILIGTLDATNVASPFCDPVKEATFLTDPTFDYSKCTPFMAGGGWPPKCEFFSQPDHSLHCGLSACPDQAFNVVDYNPSATCAVPPTVVSEQGSTGVAYLRINATVLAACDTRLDALQAIGCAPCKLLIDEDIVVTVTDATGAAVAIEIHVNP